MRTHAFTLVLSYIYGLVALLDNIQSSFSSITISTQSLNEVWTPEFSGITGRSARFVTWLGFSFSQHWKSVCAGGASDVLVGTALCMTQSFPHCASINSSTQAFTRIHKNVSQQVEISENSLIMKFWIFVRHTVRLAVGRFSVWRLDICEVKWISFMDLSLA